MGLLYADVYRLNDDLSAVIPNMGDVVDNQDEYYRLLSVFIATPFDLMVQLDDMGIDFTEITKYQLFFMLFKQVLEEYKEGGAKSLDLILTGMDFNNLYPAVDMKTEEYFLVAENRRIVINERIYLQLRSALCFINDIEKKDKTPGNDEAKAYLLERARKKQQRAMRQSQINSELEDHIVALVNTKDFKYDFDTVRDITIYMFNRSLKQIQKRMDYDQVMRGYYAGTLDIKKVSQDVLDWLHS